MELKGKINVCLVHTANVAMRNSKHQTHLTPVLPCTIVRYRFQSCPIIIFLRLPYVSNRRMNEIENQFIFCLFNMLTRKIERLDVTVDKALQFQTANTFGKMSGFNCIQK